MTEPRGNQTKKKSNWDIRRVLVAAVALAMALLMIVPLLADVFLYSYAITQEDIDALKRQKSALASQQSEAQKTLDELSRQENSAMERLNALEDQIGLLSDQINATQEIIDDYDVMIADTQVELTQAQADEEVYYELFLERVRAMEEEGTVSYWEILFQAASFSDLLDRVSFVNDVMKYDNDMLDNLEAARTAVAEAEAKLEEEQAQQEEAKAQLEDERAEQEAAAEEEEAVLAEILANEEIYAEQIAQLSTQQEELVGEISAAEQQLAAEEAARALEEQRRREEAERKAAEEAARQAAEEEAARQAAAEEAARQEQEANQNTEEEPPAVSEPEEETPSPSEPEEETPSTSEPEEETPSTSEPEEETPSPSEPEETKPTETPSISTGKNPTASVSGSSIMSYAMQFEGNPYVWGGNSLTNGIDCSGFVHAVLSHFGISSPRQSASFRSFGKAVSVENMQVGDIVCYDGHVGFYAGNGRLFSALGSNYGITYCSVYYKPILAVRRA